MKARSNIGLASEKFSKNIIRRHTTFSMPRALITFRKKVFSFLNRMNLIYAFPMMIIRRTVLTSEKTRITKTTPKTWNIFNIQAEFKFPLSRYVISPSAGILTSETSEVEANVSSHMPLLSQPSLPRTFLDMGYPIQAQTSIPVDGSAILKTVFEKQIGSISETALTHVLKTALEKPSGTLLKRSLSTVLKTVSYGFPMATKESESSAMELLTSRIIPSMQQKAPLFGGSDAYDGFTPTMQDRSRRTEPTYTLAEHVLRTSPQVIRETKERIVEKEVAPEPRERLSAPETNRLADQVYQLIERKIRIERERRGL